MYFLIFVLLIFLKRFLICFQAKEALGEPVREVEGQGVSVWPTLDHVVEIFIVVNSKFVLDNGMTLFIKFTILCFRGDYCMLKASQGHGYTRDVVQIFLSEQVDGSI